MDTHVNKSFKTSMRDKWENWLENGNVEFTKGGKRKPASYDLIGKWVHEAWITVGTKELIVKGFKENGFVDFNGSIDHLHSRLRETVTGGAPEEVLQEGDEYLREIALMDMDEVHNDDDEIQQPAEGSGHDLNPFDTNHVGVDYATSSTTNATTNSDIDDEIDVTGTDSESDNGTESDISINGE